MTRPFVPDPPAPYGPAEGVRPERRSVGATHPMSGDTMSYSYDDRCEDLARHFASDEKEITEAEIKDLAQTIQDAIEYWFEDRGRQ